MAGVVASPKRATATPRLARPATREPATMGLDNRGSLPTDTRRDGIGMLSCDDNHSANAEPTKNIIDEVSVTGSLGLRSSATPRMSDPFWSLE